MALISREQAREVIEMICEAKGGISEEDRKATRAPVLRALESVRRELGAATQIVATNLYSTNTRFVFELVQNAEDNNYAQAAAANEMPYLEFNLHSDHMVVDSNEDGFDELNVQSICSTAQSSKKNIQAYVGEKGIGFKSVFKAASKVHIQSGPFSFSFSHKRGESGLGMITPFHEEHHELPEGVRTRMILTLIDPHDFYSHAKELRAIPNSLLLFLSKLRRITINISGSDGISYSVNYNYEYHAAAKRGILREISDSNGTLREDQHEFHITKRLLTGLPRDEARGSSRQAEVVLAFPLDEDDTPIIEQQHVFAFLPLRKAGFTFQIQCDFITQASREDVLHSPWNTAILDGIAETFRDAVIQFCEHPLLQFQWMRYLPSRTISDPFWAQLRPKITELLNNTPILRSRSKRVLAIPRQLRWLGKEHLDKHSKPLFRDMSTNLYLSGDYFSEDLEILKNSLEINILSTSELLVRVRADLSSEVSVMKSAKTDQDWHTRAANLLITSFDSTPQIAREIGSLNLIPLQDGSWASTQSTAIYFPGSNKYRVPRDLDLRLVKSDALQNTTRGSLFAKLGVSNCKTSFVINLIKERYNQHNRVDLESSIDHICYLYWTTSADSADLDRRIYLFDQDETAVYRNFLTFGTTITVADLYFETEEPYEMKSILGSPDTLFSESRKPSVHFINSAYLDALSFPALPSPGELSWKSWLESRASVRHIPRLTNDRDHRKLSDLFLWIVNERQSMLPMILKAHWTTYKDMSDEIAAKLSETIVPCEGGPMFVTFPLRKTYLALPSMKMVSSKYGVKAYMPFLKLSSELAEGTRQEWDFLKMFQVGFEENLSFYLDILKFFAIYLYRFSQQVPMDRLVSLYEEIERRIDDADHDTVRDLFEKEKCICIPGQGSNAPTWVTPKKCVWKSPDFLDVNHPLQTVNDYSRNPRIGHLFSGILSVRDANWKDTIVQLEEFKRANRVYTGGMSAVYSHFFRQVSGSQDWEEARARFKASPLIYVPSQKTWYPSSACLWTEATRIEGKVAISNEYNQLKGFFVDKLAVEEPDMGMFIQELQVLATRGGNPKIQEIKEIIKEISSWNPTAGALDQLKGCTVLPIRGVGGQITLERADGIFAIIDRIAYGNVFNNKIPVLDFSIEEVHLLQPFIEALGLETRYMSLLVKEESKVDDASKEETLTEELTRKASSIFRCAVHYGALSSDDFTAWSRLLHIQVYESDGISKNITIDILGTRFSVEGAKANLHIEEDVKELKLYVPRDPVERELCYLAHIPEKLVAYFSITSIAAVKVFGDLLKVRLSSVDKLLERHGIVQVSLPNGASSSLPMEDNLADVGDRIDNSAMATEQSHSQASEGIQGTSIESRIVPSLAQSDESDWETSTSSYSHKTFPVQPRPRNFGSQAPSSASPSVYQFSFSASVSPSPTVFGAATPIPAALSSLDEYRALLDRVIRAASRGSIPPKGSPSSAGGGNASMATPIILSDAVFGLRSENQLSHDMKIGAAGELYVFEILQRLALVSREDWKSNIRGEVRVHEKYADLLPWRGVETADITYKDSTNVITSLLISLGYLDSTCSFAMPKYYFEVKTTTKDCDTRFFMSKAQYNRMNRMALAPGQRADEIYVIMRVFNVGQEDVGLRLYVDPDRMRRSGELQFEAESYTVTRGGIENSA